MLVATFVYCVLVLRHISGEATALAPSLSMTTALVLTVTTVVAIVAYLNRLAHGLQVGQVVRSIADEAYEVINASAAAAQREEPGPDIALEPADGESIVVVPAGRDGWVTQSPSEHILAALPPSTVVRLETRSGAYIHRGEVLMRVWPAPSDTEKVRQRLTATVEISDTRTMQEDIDSRCASWSTSRCGR
nr:DUF2254 family protein [Rhodococcus sp. PAE-6]